MLSIQFWPEHIFVFCPESNILQIQAIFLLLLLLLVSVVVVVSLVLSNSIVVFFFLRVEAQ